MKRRRFLKGLAAAAACAAVPWPLLGCSARRVSAGVPLTRKIGQMLLVGFRGAELRGDEAVVRDLDRFGLGGVVLFDYDVMLGSYGRNIVSPEQLRALTARLQTLSRLPLFIAVDQEGGRVARLKEGRGFPATVSARSLGEAGDLALTRRRAEQIATTLRENGINLNFAPVVDLDVNPENPVIGGLERSFSADPAVVAAHARELLLAHDRHGVLGCLKHFPGHGSSSTDSHQGFVDVTASWSESELEPYRVLIAQGLAKMVMTAHIFNRRLDPRYPATLSRATVTGLLRAGLGFDGVVVSDDLQMGAIAKNFSYEAAVEKAIQAGVDILLVANNLEYDPDVVAKTVALIADRVRSGAIAEERIDASYCRIMRLKGLTA
ncbi:MAG: glycoside hydrolase family 3 protein [Deltaproteobacteria bacterium]|nr:glycoside hydrolase family 3 protein [Deltaproteobacteria bacterium]